MNARLRPWAVISRRTSELFAVALEDGFDGRGSLSGAYGVARGAPAEEQSDGLDQD
jgi:hypothetical protein